MGKPEALRTGMIDPHEDKILLVTADGRKAAFDLRLYDPSLPDYPDSKVNQALGIPAIELQGRVVRDRGIAGGLLLRQAERMRGTRAERLVGQFAGFQVFVADSFVGGPEIGELRWRMEDHMRLPWLGRQ